ncbi:MAG TPA: hypothetical protein VFB43_12765 [Terracidiphilus sp.]|nr:hypothetical protein [Terracidiphilus sp.]
MNLDALRRLSHRRMVARVRCLLLSSLLLFAAAQSWAQTGARNGAPSHWEKLTPAAGLADSRQMRFGSSVLQVDFAPGPLDLGMDPILAHIQMAASAIVAYYGRFPASRVRILVVPVAGRVGDPQGTTWGDVDGFQGFTRLRVGEHTTQADLDDDWVTTHELVHMTFPSQEREHHWIEEGLATYVEPLARVKTGELKAQKVWNDMVRDMPKGEPQSGDQGLDHTHTWGRTYWGGALFCLAADIEIRRETKNRKGLEDALRSIADAGGTIDQDWPIEKTLDVGDRATGTHVLTTMYAAWKDAPVTVDLDKMWSDLGIRRAGDGVELVPGAPETAIREAIAGDRHAREH